MKQNTVKPPNVTTKKRQKNQATQQNIQKKKLLSHLTLTMGNVIVFFHTLLHDLENGSRSSRPA